MIHVHGVDRKSPEAQGALQLSELACKYDLEIENSPKVVLEIFPSVQCYGQKVKDIDILVFFADYREESCCYKAKCGRPVRSFCTSIEVKGHRPNAISFVGAQCSVKYNGQEHDVTKQSEDQKYSVKGYIDKNLKRGNPPWIHNLIWLTGTNSSSLPKVTNNFIAMDVTWDAFLEKLAEQQAENRPIETFSSRPYLKTILDIFKKELVPSELDRRKMEVMTQSVLNRQQYVDELGERMLIFRGRGGTGKTVRLIQIARQAYDELGLRVLFLTYNKALVADLKRVMALLKVKSSVGGAALSAMTIHSFLLKWLTELGLMNSTITGFYSRLDQSVAEAVKLLEQEALVSSDIEEARSRASRELAWDLILVDECQDWPEPEKHLIYELYGPEKVIIADGVDQFVRGVELVNWRQWDKRKFTYKIMTLKKSLRLKSSLCKTVDHFAEELELDGWNLEPVPEALGGKVIVVEGDGLEKKFHQRIAATAIAQGNQPVDFLLCVPPSWVIKEEDERHSVVAMKYEEWGLKVWDGVDPDKRDSFPTDLQQFRIVQYESCRGLEGWVVVCFALDELYEAKKAQPKISTSERNDLWFDEEEAAEMYARRWLMIPLTRAIDTLVLHVQNRDSFVGSVLKKLHDRYPEEISWVSTT